MLSIEVMFLRTSKKYAVSIRYGSQWLEGKVCDTYRDAMAWAYDQGNAVLPLKGGA